jgi:hypothetical protein
MYNVADNAICEGSIHWDSEIVRLASHRHKIDSSVRKSLIPLPQDMHIKTIQVSAVQTVLKVSSRVSEMWYLRQQHFESPRPCHWLHNCDYIFIFTTSTSTSTLWELFSQ